MEQYKYILLVCGWAPWEDKTAFTKHVTSHITHWGEPVLAMAGDSQMRFDQMAQGYFLGKIPFRGYQIPKPRRDPKTGKVRAQVDVVERGKVLSKDVAIHVIAFVGPTSRAAHFLAMHALHVSDVVEVVKIH